MTASRFNEPIEPMTLANMRENSVRSLAIDCRQRHGWVSRLGSPDRSLGAFEY
jgi:hypothetical protein